MNAVQLNAQPEEEPARKPRVAIVFGGRSSEHAVSCVTAGSVMRAIDRSRYDVVPVGITLDGRWVLERDEPERLAIAGGQLPEVDEKGQAVLLMHDASRGSLVTLDAGDVPSTLGDVDVVFPLLHGPFGEDGTLQGLLEMASIRYVGAGVLSSAVSMDKHYLKMVFQAHGLPVAPYAVLQPGEWEHDRPACAESVASLGYPVFVKPARGGSSIGISKVSGPAELEYAVEHARQFDPKVIVEASVDGARELEVGVLQSLDTRPVPEASVVAEIKVDGTRDFYDFEAKYVSDEDVELVVPAELEPGEEESVRSMAVQAFEAVSAEGLARVDFFLRPDGLVVLNEINTMPGFTPLSMFPRVWAASGVDYPELVDRLIQLALRRPTGLR
jgi:D-alanine-D-alanine ligase